MFDKSIAEMSKDELLEWVDKLRSGREALREQAIARRRAKEARGITTKEKKTRVIKPPVEHKSLNADMLKILMGEE